MRQRIRLHNSVANVPGEPQDTAQFVLYDGPEKTCDELRIWFTGLSVAAQMALTSTVSPASTTGWAAKNCGNTDGLWVEDADSGTSFLPDV
ncbi:hypothetical protein [Spirosoma sp. KNUC1025]|uniref:hypothetical protein n=1 Tax=Spirosoma sp. KNUC1025 TaxID=2894082 RepID=UPI00386471E2|nr:hypothetical protein LN737_19180 [Spirosoma sp. KNUC1025]